jgi:CRISPR-associated protein Cas1
MQLFIHTPGTYISQKDGCFRLKNREKQADFSPLKVESLVLCNKASLSTQAVALALEHNIDVIFLDGHGDPVGRVWFSKLGSTALIRRKQLEASTTPEGTRLAAEMVQQKLENQLFFLKKLMHARPGKTDIFEKPIQTVEDAVSKLKGMEPAVVDVVRGTIMGIEGTSGGAYFGCLSRLMPERYRFKGRSRQPARDPFNAALNYGYGMLYSRVEKACILAGLDPYVGFLHTDNYNKRSLVFDLIEPFRLLAERAVVYLFTGRKMGDDFFDQKEGAVSLNDQGKPVVVQAMNAHLDESVRYRGRNVRRKHIVQHEAHRLANILLAEETGIRRPEWLEIKEF